MSSVIICSLHQILIRFINSVIMRMAIHVARISKMINMCEILIEKLKERHSLGDIGVYDRIILKVN